MEDLKGSSIPENLGKIRQEIGENLGAQFWGFKLLIIPALSSTGKTLEAEHENLPLQNVDFLPILRAGVQTNGTFDLCRPLNRWGRKPRFYTQVVLSDGYLDGVAVGKTDAIL